MTEIIHASAVAAEGRAALILGRSGAGKSVLALDLIALGAGLIGDDVVRLSVSGGALIAAPCGGGDAPRLIEARGLGLIRVRPSAPAPVSLVVDLDADEAERLPPSRVWRRLGVSVPLLHRPPRLHPAAMLAALLAGGPENPDAPLASRPTVDQSAVRPRAESRSIRMD